MKTLYIIGNGFDLYHRMKTSYSDFNLFVRNNNLELDSFFYEYFNLKVNNSLWADFENDLNTFKHENFFSDKSEVDIWNNKFKPSDCYGLYDDIEQQINEYIDLIKKSFCNWIQGVNIPSKEQEGIELLSFSNNSIFLNFNYTSTLENIYEIPKSNILYIHNNVEANDYDLIFGHNKIVEDKEEVDKDGNSNRTLLTDAENASVFLLHSFLKNTNRIINEHENYFNSLNNIEDVIILGHSLSEIDMPYFNHIANKVSSRAKWKISYYKKDEKKSFLKKLQGMNIDKANINFIKIGDLHIL